MASSTAARLGVPSNTKPTAGTSLGVPVIEEPPTAPLAMWAPPRGSLRAHSCCLGRSTGRGGVPRRWPVKRARGPASPLHADFGMLDLHEDGAGGEMRIVGQGAVGHHWRGWDTGALQGSERVRWAPQSRPGGDDLVDTF